MNFGIILYCRSVWNHSFRTTITFFLIFYSTMYCIVLYFLLTLRCEKEIISKNHEEMNIDNAISQMRKGMLEYCVMLLLRKEACYTSDIITRLKEAKLIVVEGTLYPLLNRLKKDGLLSYEWRESTQGPPRKYYLLTNEGEEFLRQLDEVWIDMSNSITHIKGRAESEE